MILKITFYIILTACTFSWAANANLEIPGKGLVAEGNKDWQKAISIYLDFLSQHPDRADVWLRVGSIEHHLKNYPQAINAYQHASQIQPQNAMTHKTLSEIYAESQQPQDSLNEINLAVKLQPNNINYWEARAKLANWNRNPEIALESYQQILILDKNQNVKIDKMQILMQIANLQSQLRKYPDAIDTYNKLLTTAADKDKAVIYKNISETYAGANQPQQAMNAINNALQIEPQNINFLIRKATFASWLRNQNLALETYKQILKLEPNNEVALNGLKSLGSSPQTLANKTTKGTTNITTSNATSNPTKVLTPFEQYINSANAAAMKHNYRAAANAMQKAIAIKPRDADLYKKLSEIYATGKMPARALAAINKAVALRPNNINYLRARAKLAAWAVDKNTMLDSYQRILILKPYDEDAMLNLAHTLAWQGRTDDAIKVYRQFLKIYPRNAQGWLQYAEVESWTGGYVIALNALEHYRQLKGITTEYLQTKARVLSLVGRFRSALAINDPLLRKRPWDPYLLTTEVTALVRANHINDALYYLEKIEKLNSPENQSISKVTRTPLRSNINLETDWTQANDTTKILDVPLTAQYFLDPTTSILFWGLYERATASPTSQLVPVTGGTSIDDESAMLGMGKQWNGLNLKGLLGALHIQGLNNHGIWDALANTNLGETAQLTIENLHNLFRPYLVPQTPKSISLQIMETRVATLFQWQPIVEKYFNMVFAYSQLSDNNNYLHVNVWPKMRAFTSQRWLITLGVDGDFWHFGHRPTNGYYSPLHFQGYEGTAEFYYSQSENIGYSFSGGFGLQKDETFPHYYYEEDLAAQLFFGIFTDWELRISGGFTLRDNPIHNYNCWTIGGILTRRF